MKKLIGLLLLFAAIDGFSQTKKIAHRSHSGSSASFDVEGEDDFGLYPSRKKAAKDSAAKKQVASRDSIPVKKPVPPKFVKAKLIATRKTKQKV